jgi:hypothetical protein
MEPAFVSVSATGSLSAEIAAKARGTEDSLRHPEYSLNVVSKEYWEFQDVFSKTGSERLPKLRGENLDHQIPLEPKSRPPYLL